MRVWPGRPYPLGATWDGAGVNFAIFSEHATKVELCLFDAPPDDPQHATEVHRIVLPEQTDQVWHGYLPDVQPDQLFGLTPFVAVDRGVIAGVGTSPNSSATFDSMASAQTRCPSSLGCSQSGINAAGMLPSGRTYRSFMSR